MESLNSALQQEVLMLRSEVQQLKSILIAHKDCPLIVHHTKGEALFGPPVSSNTPRYDIHDVVCIQPCLLCVLRQW